MPDVVAIVVDWLGPFRSLKDARTLARKFHFGDALYLATGKLRYQRNRSMQYVGISGQIEQRLHEGRFSRIAAQLEIWVGSIASHAVAGKRRVRHAQTTDLAEWGTAYFLQLPLNVNKRKKPPPSAILISNRWYHQDRRPRIRRPIKDWPDIIEYDGAKGPARIAWLTHPHRNRRLSPDGVRSLRLE